MRHQLRFWSTLRRAPGEAGRHLRFRQSSSRKSISARSPARPGGTRASGCSSKKRSLRSGSSAAMKISRSASTACGSARASDALTRATRPGITSQA